MSELRHQFHGHNDGTFTVSASQDVEPILERNKALQNAGKQKGDFRLIASIPAIMIEKWLNEEGVPVLKMNKHEFNKFIRKKLNDPDNKWLRINHGRM